MILQLTSDIRFYPVIQELAVLELWDQIDAFGEQLRRTEGKPE